ncbi:MULTISPECIES: LysR family transcriptional regulator [unclassified Janthinobacterium]|uniref:LysR family transcriptional regulator n=1 Tax=unclassified Janthinobacterium TaxID=2610881 RepID=UPI00161D1F11|nr:MULTISPECIES: LysR family transcriptional regulator [unclassified Janthinobacterium]MBB5610671.1 DNA-binding transcriptional LysR family regulator [Janthinobacterium sp. S3T4]MBB5616157.1 DNA-binding transcriptional LysR family regulator [Janthinobacterium sp. S3M3]
MISIKQFRYFVEIVDAGSYSRAAEKLYVAQSALSRQIKELENAVQALLLTRDARHIELTPAGQVFYERSKRILEDIDETVRQTRHVGQGAQGIIRFLHSSSVTLTPAIGALLNRLLAQFPGVSLDISKDSSENQALDIEEGRADLGLVRLPTLRKHANIIVRELYQEKLVLAVSQDSPLAAQTRTSIAALRDQAFVSIPHKDRGGLSYLVAGMCLAQGFFPKAARALSRKTTQLHLIEANLGIAIVPDSMRLVAPPGVRFLDLPEEESPSTVALISPRAASGMVAAFADAFVREMAAGASL